MFSINIQSGVPIYEQLVKRISELIIAGTILTDEKMPTIREVAKELGINPNTVQKSYQLLEQAGFIYSIPGKGSYARDLNDKMHRIKEKAVEIFSEHAREALKQGLEKSELIDTIQKL